MHSVDDPPLGPLAEDAYQQLLDTIDPSEGISIDEAHQRLCEGEFSSEEEAEYAVGQLLDRGYLYAVEGTLFITDRTDTSR